jgi:hypothetical protein
MASRNNGSIDPNTRPGDPLKSSLVNFENVPRRRANEWIGSGTRSEKHEQSDKDFRFGEYSRKKKNRGSSIFSSQISDTSPAKDVTSRISNTLPHSLLEAEAEARFRLRPASNCEKQVVRKPDKAPSTHCTFAAWIVSRVGGSLIRELNRRVAGLPLKSSPRKFGNGDWDSAVIRAVRSIPQLTSDR